MNIQKVTRYLTSDGKYFEFEWHAAEHELSWAKREEIKDFLSEQEMDDTYKTCDDMADILLKYYKMEKK